MKTSLRNTTATLHAKVFFICLFLLIQLYAVSISTANQDENQQKELTPLVEPNVVGKINDYSITRQELEKRLLMEMEPDPYKMYTEQTKPTDANSMLLQMLGEKAIVIDARKQGLLQDELVQQAVNTYREQQILNLWVNNNVNKVRDKIKATEDEIDNQLKANPKMERERAKSVIESAKANKILDQLYDELCKKSDIKKIAENFPKAVELHDKLLNHPKKPETMKYIRNYQIKEELTEQEQNIVLATFSHGKVTLRQFFDTLCDIAPPSRPKDLDTTKGIEQLLDKALVKPLITADAKVLGLDKDSGFLKQIKEREDNELLNNVRSKKYSEVNEPSKDEISAFYNNNKEFFTTDRMLKIDQIWCQNLETANRVKAEITNDRDFYKAKKEHSLYPDEQAITAYPNSEGFFWKEIWKGEPNQIIGPVKGFRSGEIKWRIVKILEKKPGTQQKFTPELENGIKYLIMSEKSTKIITDYCLKTLKKYPYEIYSDKIKDIDPINIP